MAVNVGKPLLREAGLADRVAEHMTEQVIDGTLPRGTRLPAERVLAEQFGVSRTVIREAVRTLASKGLLETRGGSGTYVRSPDPAGVAASLSLFMRLHHGNLPVPYEKVHEVRSMLEVEIASLTATRAQPDDIAELERQVQRQRRARRNRDTYVASDVAFHTALAVATHNELFPVLLNSISDVMMEIRQLGFQVTDAHESGIDHHQRILEYVKGGDAVGAAHAMKEHLNDSLRILRQGLEIKATRLRDQENTGQAT